MFLRTVGEYKPCSSPGGFTSLPNDIFLHLSKLKALADEKIDVTEILKLVLGRVENIMEKGKSTSYQHFLLFQQCFQKGFFSEVVKTRDCLVNDTSLTLAYLWIHNGYFF